MHSSSKRKRSASSRRGSRAFGVYAGTTRPTSTTHLLAFFIFLCLPHNILSRLWRFDNLHASAFFLPFLFHTPTFPLPPTATTLDTKLTRKTQPRLVDASLFIRLTVASDETHYKPAVNNGRGFTEPSNTTITSPEFTTNDTNEHCPKDSPKSLRKPAAYSERGIEEHLDVITTLISENVKDNIIGSPKADNDGRGTTHGNDYDDPPIAFNTSNNACTSASAVDPRLVNEIFSLILMFAIAAAKRSNDKHLSAMAKRVCRHYAQCATEPTTSGSTASEDNTIEITQAAIPFSEKAESTCPPIVTAMEVDVERDDTKVEEEVEVTEVESESERSTKDDEKMGDSEEIENNEVESERSAEDDEKTSDGEEIENNVKSYKMNEEIENSLGSSGMNEKFNDENYSEINEVDGGVESSKMNEIEDRVEGFEMNEVEGGVESSEMSEIEGGVNFSETNEVKDSEENSERNEEVKSSVENSEVNEKVDSEIAKPEHLEMIIENCEKCEITAQSEEDRESAKIDDCAKEATTENDEKNQGDNEEIGDERMEIAETMGKVDYEVDVSVEEMAVKAENEKHMGDAEAKVVGAEAEAEEVNETVQGESTERNVEAEQTGEKAEDEAGAEVTPEGNVEIKEESEEAAAERRMAMWAAQAMAKKEKPKNLPVVKPQKFNWDDDWDNIEEEYDDSFSWFTMTKGKKVKTSKQVPSSHSAPPAPVPKKCDTKICTSTASPSDADKQSSATSTPFETAVNERVMSWSNKPEWRTKRCATKLPAFPPKSQQPQLHQRCKIELANEPNWLEVRAERYRKEMEAWNALKEAERAAQRAKEEEEERKAKEVKEAKAAHMANFDTAMSRIDGLLKAAKSAKEKEEEEEEEKQNKMLRNIDLTQNRIGEIIDMERVKSMFNPGAAAVDTSTSSPAVVEEGLLPEPETLIVAKRSYSSVVVSSTPRPNPNDVVGHGAARASKPIERTTSADNSNALQQNAADHPGPSRVLPSAGHGAVRTSRTIEKTASIDKSSALQQNAANSPRLPRVLPSSAVGHGTARTSKTIEKNVSVHDPSTLQQNAADGPAPPRVLPSNCGTTGSKKTIERRLRRRRNELRRLNAAAGLSSNSGGGGGDGGGGERPERDDT